VPIGLVGLGNPTYASVAKQRIRGEKGIKRYPDCPLKVQKGAQRRYYVHILRTYKSFLHMDLLSASFKSFRCIDFWD